MAVYIEPKILKGFRDFLPDAEIVRRNLTEKIENVFCSFGFVPIDTPAMEYAEILLGKGGGETEKQIYRFKDNGERDVALRFDLTVPFARFIALHRAELTFPFKRYHIGKVWRGENTQRGRFREFTQCDFDIIGSDSPSSDFEILLLIQTTLLNLGLEITIHVNHRGLFNKFLQHINQSEKLVDVLRTVDKLSKVGEEETKKSLESIAGEENAKKILEFIGAKGNFTEVLNRITELSGGSSPESDRLLTLYEFMKDANAGNAPNSEPFVLDPSITRGLDYYTGVVFETFLNDLPDIGSICSGGRYDNLCALYSKEKETVSGVGSSIGLDRLLAALETVGKLPAAKKPQIAIACVNAEKSGEYQALAQSFRKDGINCEVFLDAGAGGEKQPVKQFVLAEKKGIRYVIIPGDEPLKDKMTLRNLSTRENREVSVEEAKKTLK
ncbi:MAG: histidine--tRNA ligase [Treponema sp.]|nr:histidine--tRNA ligase [Treponema sp.]MCL2237367.1 histidine--tRNA ligase [Treponema sp.]